MKELSATGNPAVDAKLRSFAAYFEATWIDEDFSPDLWNHYDHQGPHTTNLAEGFHNSLNSRFGVPHPSLRTFLDWLQKCQYETQCRVIQLASGRPPKLKAAVYVKLYADVHTAKLHYGMEIAHIFALVFPKPEAWNMFQSVSCDYLRRVSYLIGV